MPIFNIKKLFNKKSNTLLIDFNNPQPRIHINIDTKKPKICANMIEYLAYNSIMVDITKYIEHNFTPEEKIAIGQILLESKIANNEPVVKPTSVFKYEE